MWERVSESQAGASENACRTWSFASSCLTWPNASEICVPALASVPATEEIAVRTSAAPETFAVALLIASASSLNWPWSVSKICLPFESDTGGGPSALTESANACVDALASLTTASRVCRFNPPPFRVVPIDRSDAVYVVVAAHNPFAHCWAAAAAVVVVEPFPEPPQPATTAAVATTRSTAIGHRRLTPTWLHAREGT